MDDNVILIGMPASGKSTAGVRAAKILGYSFLDCDLLIQNATDELLYETIQREGPDEFIRLEEKINATIHCHKTVISTGGSAVYSEKAMTHFRSIGKIIYLSLSLDEVKKRIGGDDLFMRGVVMKKNVKTIDDLYAERAPLYEKFANYIIYADGQTLEETVKEIVKLVRGN